MLRKLLLLAAGLAVLVSLPLQGDWERTRLPDGTYTCQNEEGFQIRPADGTIKNGCSNFTQLWNWLGTAEALTIKCIPSFDGTCSTLYRAGDKPQGGGDDCIALFDGCASYGTSSGQYEDVSGDQRITDETGEGWETAYIEFADEDDLQFTTCPQHTDGSSAVWASAGAFMADGGTDFANDYINISRLTPGNSTGYVAFDNNGVFDWTQMPYVPDCEAITHDASTDITRLWGSEDNGLTYDVIASEVRDFGAGRIGLYVTSTNPTTSSTFTHFNVNFSNNITLIDGGGGGGSPGTAPANPFTNLPGGPGWLNGLYHVQDAPTGWNQWEAWMGHEMDIVGATLIYNANYPTSGGANNCADTWAQFAASPLNNNCNVWVRQALDNNPNDMPVVMTTTMVPWSHSNRNCARVATWTEMAAGNYDSYWATFAANLKSLLDGRSQPYNRFVIRLGWEGNGYWYAHSVCSAVTAFKTSWGRVVDILRAAMPGLLIEFSPAFTAYMGQASAGASGNCNLACMLPASSKYDFLAVSYHDPGVANQADWLSKVYDPSGARIGLVEFFETAQSVNKLMAISEWAVQMTDCDANWVTSPNPALFLNNMNAAIASFGPWFGYETYFTVACTRLHTRQGSAAGLAYKAGWDP